MSSSLTSVPPAPTSTACGGGGQGSVFFAGRLSPMATTLESGYTVDSSGYVSYHSVPNTPFEPEMPLGGLMHPYISAPPVVYDEHAILEQLMAENGESR
ncbi:hypothetical protein AAVH_11822 [Aphelenchoides avenae]|nr:hypothetical protein AAVH_11822 [Aphelenchus avenae]